MSEEAKAPSDLAARAESPFVYQALEPADDPWDCLAALVEDLVGSAMITGVLLKRYEGSLEAAQREGEILPVGQDRLERLLEDLRKLRGVLLCSSVSACQILDAYPELAEVLPDLDELLEPELEGEPRAAGPGNPERAPEAVTPGRVLTWPPGPTGSEDPREEDR